MPCCAHVTPPPPPSPTQQVTDEMVEKAQSARDSAMAAMSDGEQPMWVLVGLKGCGKWEGLRVW